MKTQRSEAAERKARHGKRPLYLLFLLLAWNFGFVRAQVVVTDDAGLPDPSAMLDVRSTHSGLLFPRMNQAQRALILSPPDGLIVYQTDSYTGLYSGLSSGWKLNSLFSSPSMTQGGLFFINGNEMATNAGQLIWDVANTRVGIGTGSPQQKLSVNGMAESLSGGTKFPDGTVQTKASKGCLITFAANLDAAGQYLRPFGDADAEDWNSSGIRTVFPIPLSGRIVAVAWRSLTGDNTTQFQVHYGSSYSSFTLSGQNGLNSGLNYSVTAGQIMEVYHVSGTLPAQIILSFYLNE